MVPNMKTLHLTALTLSLYTIPSNAFDWRLQHGHETIGSYFGLPGQNATYDYVIVGGGTAGMVVAERLAENRSVSVAVIEPGSFYEFLNSNMSQIPYYSEGSVSADPNGYINRWIDWDLVTEPQPQLNNRRIHYAQGKALGGSSARNQMIYQRGSKGSYDYWAQLVGDAAYSWSNMLPHFKRSVHFTPPNYGIRGANTTASYEADAYSPSGGPLKVSYSNYAMPFSPYGINAIKKAGLSTAPGFTAGDLYGVTYTAFTIDAERQHRSSSEASFMDHAITANLPLTIYPQTQAMKISFNTNKTATGVHVRSTDNTMSWHLRARREVILAAGVAHSPQLLMVSGIGPTSTLHDHNITVLHDLPGVGQNMHDSCNIGSVTHNITVRTPPITPATTQAYLNNASGILTNSGGDVLAFEKLPAYLRSNLSASTLSDLARWPADWPEVEYVPSARGGPTGTNSASIAMLLVATTSRGNVTLRSASMLDKPIINTNWLLSRTDQEVAVAAYRRARQMWAHMDPSIIDSGEILPGSEVQSDAALLEAIRGEVGAIHHWSSTCMMGREGEAGAVVDAVGKVFGVNGLRVVDSSSFRFTPPGHTQAATYAHAEKLVEDIICGR